MSSYVQETMERHRDAVEAFKAARIAIIPQKDPKHWKLQYGGITVGYWPNTGTFYVYGKSFKPKLSAFIDAITSGRIRMPDEADERTCKFCQQTIWWVKTPSGKSVPLDLSGESHLGTCAERKDCA